MITVANGSSRHACAVMIAAIASFGWPIHCTSVVKSMKPSFQSTQFTMLNCESKIQSHPSVVSATGAAHGSRIRKRMNHLPRKSLMRKCARNAAQTTTIACETNVKRNVFRSASRKTGSSHWLAKFSSPTQSPRSEPAVAFVNAR